LQVVSGSCFWFLLGFLILGSVLSLYYYLRFLFIFFVVVRGVYIVDFLKFFRLSIGLGMSFFLLGFPFYECFFYILV
jgi:NADH:ubiquinone oxidoreductase subunit 2 (subunit N)